MIALQLLSCFEQLKCMMIMMAQCLEIVATTQLVSATTKCRILICSKRVSMSAKLNVFAFRTVCTRVEGGAAGLGLTVWSYGIVA